MKMNIYTLSYEIYAFSISRHAKAMIRILPTVFREYGANPVETQNLASSVGSIATHAGNKALTKLDLPTRETQDFASLLFITCIMILSFLLCIAMASAQ